MRLEECIEEIPVNQPKPKVVNIRLSGAKLQYVYPRKRQTLPAECSDIKLFEGKLYIVIDNETFSINTAPIFR